MSRNLPALSGKKGWKDNLFERLGALSGEDGAPGREAVRRLAEEFLMGPAAVYGTSTFYDFTRPENRGRKVYICSGTSCMLAGTQEALKDRMRERFGEAGVGEMCCLGRCHQNGAFQFGGNNYAGLPPAVVDRVLSGQLEGGMDSYRVGSRGTALLTAPFPPLEEARRDVGNMLGQEAGAVLDQVRASGLRGRGGAGFPIAAKMEACRRAPADQKFVVCNADEGDPGSFSDRYLLEQRPFAVLLGMVIAGYAVGAHTGIIYLRAEYPESMVFLEDALARLRKAGLAGENLAGSGFRFDFKLIRARGAYICGEETALLASIEGQRPEVRLRPPYPAEEGLFGKPTLLSNVETLANLYRILLDGGRRFAGIGTERSTGTKLLSLDGAFRQPGVYEVPMGTPLRTLTDELGGGFRHPLKALHVGGPLGGLIPVGKIDELTVDFESFRKHGFLLGHASVVGIPKDFPMIEYLEHLFAFTAHESCGKCFPCRLGSVRGMELLHKAGHENRRIDPELFEDLLDALERGSLCGLGSGMPLPVRNALHYFREELEPFFQLERGSLIRN